MARKKRDSEGIAKTTLQQAIANGVEKMLEKHYDEAIAYLEEAEPQRIKITFGVTVDLTKTEPNVNVGIRFSQAVTDDVSMSLTDINQGEFEEIVKDDGSGESDETDAEKERQEQETTEP